MTVWPGPWSWTVWNCSAGTGLTDRGGPTASAGLGTAPQAGCSAAEFATFIKEKLSACSIRFVETGRPVRRVAGGGRRLRLHALRRPGGGV